MANRTRFFISLAGLLVCLFIWTRPIPTGSGSIPPIGSLFNPYSGFWRNAEPLSYKDQFLKVHSGYSGHVIFDERMVPHIFTSDPKSVAFIQGYLHAKYRLFQMDIMVRGASGRLSEVLGERTIPIDLKSRRMGLSYGAEKNLQLCEQSENISVVEAYTAGINTYIKDLSPARYPIEFKLLNYKPELWTPLKTFLILMSLNETLIKRADDILYTNLVNKIGLEEFQSLFPPYNPKQSPVIPDDVRWEFSNNFDTIESQELPPILGSPLRINSGMNLGFVGSNSWAVSGWKSSTGVPFLCNDPHLPLTLPSIWFENQLSSADFNCYGVSVPGIPQIIIGFNEYIAWGMTNVGLDVRDFYRIKWTSDSKDMYELDGEAIPVTYRVENIKVKGGTAVLDTVKFTYWGPVQTIDSLDVAILWLATIAPEKCILNTLTELNRSREMDDFLRAIEHFESPPQNIVFACKNGDIALKVQGRLPVKRKNQGLFVQDGSKSINKWLGFIPQSETPSIINPKRGYVSSANQHSTNPDYPYFYYGYYEDYRSRTLNMFLDSMEAGGLEQMKRFQNSTFNLAAAEILPLFLREMDKRDLDIDQNEILEQLKIWEYEYHPDLCQPVIFELWTELFEKMVWDEFAEETGTWIKPDLWRTIQLLEEDPANIYFDNQNTSEREHSNDMVYLSFLEMIDSIYSLNEAHRTSWQVFRNFTIHHIGRIPAFSQAGLKVGGSGKTLNANNGVNGPSWRMIVSLGEEIQAWGAIPSGQSGNPGSHYYKTGIEKWEKGDYFRLNFMKSPKDTVDKAFELKFNP